MLPTISCAVLAGAYHRCQTSHFRHRRCLMARPRTHAPRRPLNWLSGSRAPPTYSSCTNRVEKTCVVRRAIMASRTTSPASTRPFQAPTNGRQGIGIAIPQPSPSLQTCCSFHASLSTLKQVQLTLVVRRITSSIELDICHCHVVVV
jgi:hypothetical protein